MIMAAAAEIMAQAVVCSRNSSPGCTAFGNPAPGPIRRFGPLWRKRPGTDVRGKHRGAAGAKAILADSNAKIGKAWRRQSWPTKPSALPRGIEDHDPFPPPRHGNRGENLVRPAVFPGFLDCG
jgi:hypothetical protein